MNFDASKCTKDEALLELYRLLQTRNAPKPGSFSAMQGDERRRYFREAKQRSRQRQSAAAGEGAPLPTKAAIRDALADAALMMLAVDAPGAAMIREVLSRSFATRPGLPLTIEQKARAGALRPKTAIFAHA